MALYAGVEEVTARVPYDFNASDSTPTIAEALIIQTSANKLINTILGAEKEDLLGGLAWLEVEITYANIMAAHDPKAYEPFEWKQVHRDVLQRFTDDVRYNEIDFG